VDEVDDMDEMDGGSGENLVRFVHPVHSVHAPSAYSFPSGKIGYNMRVMRDFLSFFVVLVFLLNPLAAQDLWEVPKRKQPVRVDGHLDEWQGVPAIVLAPGRGGVSPSGNFKTEDLQVVIRSLWDKERLYLALEWKDDVWDIRQIRRQEAVWVSPDGQRRDRMTFFDNLRFQIKEVDYDYTLWMSPRVEDRGPYAWNRLLKKVKGVEVAVQVPAIAVRYSDGVATMELALAFKDLRLKGKAGRRYPVHLLVVDSDSPGAPLELKVNSLKWLEWNGQIVLRAEGQ
jgi:hypothetical protein